MAGYNCNKDPFASLRQTAPPQWLEEMLRHFEETGEYRASDVRRLLGDPARAVDIGPRTQPLVTHPQQESGS